MNRDNDKENTPLDPAIEKVRRRMMRLMAISVTIMMAGIIAVIGAVFYKINNRDVDKTAIMQDVGRESLFQQFNNGHDGKNDFANPDGNIVLTSGSRIVETDLSGERILLTVKTGKDELALWIYDLKSNRVISRIRITEQETPMPVER